MRFSSRPAVGSPVVRLAYLFVLTTLLALLAMGGVVAGASLLPSTSPSPAACAAVFCPGGPLTTARAYHTATRLLDGRVLIVGGEGVREHNVATAELWEPASETSALTGPPAEPRSQQTATLLQDGRVLIVGSMDNSVGSVLDSVEVWDPKTETFAPTGSLIVGRGIPHRDAPARRSGAHHRWPHGLLSVGSHRRALGPGDRHLQPCGHARPGACESHGHAPARRQGAGRGWRHQPERGHRPPPSCGTPRR